jgi:hypothetical protein
VVRAGARARVRVGGRNLVHCVAMSEAPTVTPPKGVDVTLVGERGGEAPPSINLADLLFVLLGKVLNLQTGQVKGQEGWGCNSTATARRAAPGTAVSRCGGGRGPADHTPHCPTHTRPPSLCLSVW